MLSEISKKDKQWRDYAYNLTGSKDVGDEVVQEMYLKLLDVCKELNDFYVILTIRSVYIDYLRENKRIKLVELPMYIHNDEAFELDDEESWILNNLTHTEKVLLTLNQVKSLRKIEKELNINYGLVYRIIKDVKDRSKQLRNGKK
jgi:DNA-directed RNA polymerase specialized sigma24 family protein